ncbi:MAG: hypothetical protein Q8Q62_01635 [Mesorhizobium sp.]|nr:hypothetical protein [Mesorhizobium sp.]
MVRKNDPVGITQEQAYRAMLRFLEMQFDRTHSDELGTLLGSASLLEDGKPADPALEADWRACVVSVLASDSAAQAAE